MSLKDNSFEEWNRYKKYIDSQPVTAFPYAREVWWCVFGFNIGAEINGKNDDFKRPALVLHVFNVDTLIVFPLTSKEKNDQYHYKIKTEDLVAWVKLSQIRVISSKRLLRKVDIVGEEDFKRIRMKFFELIKSKPARSAGISEAEALMATSII